jgi:hypothetical protein
MRSGLVGHAAGVFKSFWPAAQVVHAAAAIENIANSRKKGAMARGFMRVPEALKASLEQF